MRAELHAPSGGAGAPSGGQIGFGTSTKMCSTPKRVGEQIAEAADAERLRGVVPGGEEVDAVLARLEHHALDRLARQEGVEAGGDGVAQVRASRRR